MSNFKISKKDFISDSRTTLNDLHEKKMKIFESESKKLSSLESELLSLKKELLNINNNQQRVIINEKIKNLEERVLLIKNNSNMINYLLDFIPFANKIELIESSETENNTPKKGTLDNFINSKIDNSKIELFNEYIKKFNPEGINKIQIFKEVSNKCANCNNNNFVIDYRQSCEICNTCGKIEYLLELPYTNKNSNYSEDINHQQVNYFEYKRKNHFIECLNQLQAKENTKIPDKIINDLTNELKKYNISDPRILTPKLIKQYLKKLNYSKYYEHIPVIINEFCGIKAPKMTPELEIELKILFDNIQEPFKKYSEIINPKRKNFLNYNYILYKFCELLGKNQLLSYFPLLKSREKLYEHDMIWKGICNDLNWKFIPSI
jgi:hypothetical protein